MRIWPLTATSSPTSNSTRCPGFASLLYRVSFRRSITWVVAGRIGGLEVSAVAVCAPHSTQPGTTEITIAKKTESPLEDRSMSPPAARPYYAPCTGIERREKPATRFQMVGQLLGVYPGDCILLQAAFVWRSQPGLG